MTLRKVFLVFASILSGCVFAGCDRPQGTKPESDKSGSPTVVSDRGAAPAGERIESFESIPADVKQAIKDGKTVWAIEGFHFSSLVEEGTGQRHALYLILQRGKLKSLVQKSYVHTDKSDHVGASSYPASKFPLGPNFTFMVEGSQDGETRIKLSIQKDTKMNRDPNNIITGESTIDLTLVWNKGGDKGSWEATEEGWTQVQSRGKQFDRQPINRVKDGFATRLSAEKNTGIVTPAPPVATKDGPARPPSNSSSGKGIGSDDPPIGPKEPTAKPNPPKTSGRVAIYKVVVPGDVLLTTSEEEVKELRSRYPGNFTGDRGHDSSVLGYAFGVEQPGTIRLRRYFVLREKRHVYLTEGNFPDSYAKEEILDAWVLKEKSAGTSLRIGFIHEKGKSMEYGPDTAAGPLQKRGYTATTWLRFYVFDKPESVPPK